MSRNLTLLALSQGLWICYSSAFITLAAVVGEHLSPGSGLATAPYGLVTTVTACAAIPASWAMARLGRRAGFVAAALMGVLGAGLAMAATILGSFALFFAAAAFVGGYQVFTLYYRFAAIEAAPDRPAFAISITLAGGLLAAFVGPHLGPIGMDLLAPYPFAGTYLILMGVGLLAAALAAGVRLPPPPAPTPRRPDQAALWRVLPGRPRFVVGVLSASAAYATMAFVMTATPLAMLGCGYTLGQAATVIQWHVVSMFAPSFVTGGLIRRLGVLPVLMTGLTLLVGAAGVALSGVEIWRFTLGLMLLGVGWNLAYVAGSALIAESAAPEERAGVQGAGEFVIFTSVALAVAASGWVLTAGGWSGVAGAAVPFLAAAALAVLWFAARERRAGRALSAPAP